MREKKSPLKQEGQRQCLSLSLLMVLVNSALNEEDFTLELKRKTF